MLSNLPARVVSRTVGAVPRPLRSVKRRIIDVTGRLVEGLGTWLTAKTSWFREVRIDRHRGQTTVVVLRPVDVEVRVHVVPRGRAPLRVDRVDTPAVELGEEDAPVRRDGQAGRVLPARHRVRLERWETLFSRGD
jgi:hypothetical protein